jgi:hypothetical protein
LALNPFYTVHDYTLSGTDNIGNRGAGRWNEDILNLLRYWVGIMKGHCREREKEQSKALKMKMSWVHSIVRNNWDG